MERSKYLLGADKYDMIQSSVASTPGIDPKRYIFLICASMLQNIFRMGMVMSIDGAAAMRAIADPHTTTMTSSGPKVDESLSSQLGGWNIFNLNIFII